MLMNVPALCYGDHKERLRLYKSIDNTFLKQGHIRNSTAVIRWFCTDHEVSPTDTECQNLQQENWEIPRQS